MIYTLQELNNVVNDVVNRIVAVSTQKTLSSNYYASYDMVADLISYEDFLNYFNFIGNELASREEVLDFDHTDEKEFDVVYGTDWCPNFEDHDDRFIARPVSQPLSMTRKAEILDYALQNVQKELDRAGEDKLVQAAEFFGVSVEELSRLDLPAAKEAVLEADVLTRKAAQLNAQRDFSRPIEFELFFNNDLITRTIYGTFEEALEAYRNVPAGMEKELYCCTYGPGKIIAEEDILLRSNSDGKDWANEYVFSDNPHICLASAKAVLALNPENLKAWEYLNLQESIVGVTGHRLGPHDLQVGNWRVHLIPPGGKYGVDDCITNTGNEFLVEFYDMRYRNPVHFPNGQFTGGRYYARTLLEDRDWSRGDFSRGLCLAGDVPSWSVSGPQLKVAMQFIREETGAKQRSSLTEKISSAESRTAAAGATGRTAVDERSI